MHAKLSTMTNRDNSHMVVIQTQRMPARERHELYKVEGDTKGLHEKWISTKKQKVSGGAER